MPVASGVRGSGVGTAASGSPGWVGAASTVAGFHALKRSAARAGPSIIQVSTASAAAASTSGSWRSSSALNRVSTWSRADPPCPSSPTPMPTRRRAHFWVSISATTERSPLWVPALPSARIRSFPKGRSKSSTTMSMSSSGTRSRARYLRTATPDRFMYVVGFTSTRSVPANRPRTVTAASRAFWRPDSPARSANRSRTSQPTL